MSMCVYCHGSGEGMYDGTVCRACGGLGEHKEDDEEEVEYERDDPADRGE